MDNDRVASESFQNYNKRVEEFRSTDFQHLKGEVYLDHAGATVYSQLHLSRVMSDMISQTYGNPHSKNVASERTRKIIEEARNKTLQHFNSTSEFYTVIFVQNCSAALNLVASCFKFNASTPVDFQRHSKNQKITYPDISSFNLSEKPLQHDYQYKGVLAYLDDSHTSVVGMRGPVSRKGCMFVCLTEKETSDALDCCGATIHKDEVPVNEQGETLSNNLFVYPAQSNFSGERYPLSWVDKIGKSKYFLNKKGKWSILLDASSFLTTSTIDLSIVQPDFLCFSFYKIFGFPTGLGCLLVKNSSQEYLEKCYFGGGTIDVLLPDDRFEVFRSSFIERYEDGTLPYLEILTVNHAFDSLHKLCGAMSNISQHTFALACYTYNELKQLRFSNGQKVIELYHTNDFNSHDEQGPIINFNVLESDGSYLGFSQVEEMAKLHKINLRTGCFCNIGACQKHFKLSSQTIVNNYMSGHVCGDEVDLIQGRPTGSIRVSFGFSSTLSDVKIFLEFIQECFLRRGNIALEKICKNKDMELDNKICWLKEIWIYPIKSCSGIKLNSCPITERGLRNDRQWMVVDKSGKGLTQKNVSDLCRIKCIIKNEILVVKCEGFSDMIINSGEPDGSSVCMGKICGESVSTVKCSERINQWFSSLLNLQNVCLSKQSDIDSRTSKEAGKDAFISLANKEQFLLIGSASLQLLSDTMSRGSDLTMSMDGLARRFRANFIVHTSTAFEEETWDTIRIGSETFKKVGLCIRCKTICFDQDTGIASKEPLLTLMSIPGRKVTFGILLIHLKRERESNPYIFSGDFLEVLKFDT